MQNAEVVLGVLRERGRQGLPCEQLYRQLFNPQLYLVAYGRIYANTGAMTPGVTQETPDGMSMEKIGQVTDLMRHERYRFSPARRVHIPKKNGGSRPLGLPTWSDKLVGEVVRLLLEAYYEPQFSDRSHGFRPGRGCHTALREIERNWKGITWFIEGEISDCFGSLDHEVLLSILAEKIRDNRFLRLIKQMLQAGYLEDWVWGATLSGAPQGGVASPLLSNIYLHKLDEFVETVLIPEYTRGGIKAINPAYSRLSQAKQRAYKRGDQAKVRALWKQIRTLPSRDPNDPDYRRLRYIRYADDQLLGFTGPKAEAEQIKHRLTVFLRDELKLELSTKKTLITHARTGAARFLGYTINVQHTDTKLTRGRRAVNGAIRLGVPPDVIRQKCVPYMRRGKPERRPVLIHRDDYDIVRIYGAEYRGIIQYYQLAQNVYRFSRLQWVAVTSMLKTLANKHNSRVTKMANKYKTVIETPQGKRTCFEARVPRKGKKPLVARFGGIPLVKQQRAILHDHAPKQVHTYPRKELIKRLRTGKCELCHDTDNVQVHHVRTLAELGKPNSQKPVWMNVMANKRRKTLIVCARCHDHIHTTQLTA